MSTDWEVALRELVPPPTVVETEQLPGMSETDTLIGGFCKLLYALGYEPSWQAVPNPLTGGVKLRLAAQRREG